MRQHALDSFLGHAHLLSDQQHHFLQANEVLPQGLEDIGAGSAARGPVPFPPEGRRAADFNQLLLPLLPPGTPPLRVSPRENAKPAGVSAGEPGFTTEALAERPLCRHGRGWTIIVFCKGIHADKCTNQPNVQPSRWQPRRLPNTQGEQSNRPRYNQ